jgi:hypothetical protein
MLNNLPIYQILAIGGSILIILFLIELVRSRRLKESYSLLWFGIALAFLLFSVWRDLLAYVASLLGVDYPPAALFLILIMGLYLLSVHFSIVISRLSEKNKNLSQEIGLMNLKIKELKKLLEGKFRDF